MDRFAAPLATVLVAMGLFVGCTTTSGETSSPAVPTGSAGGSTGSVTPSSEETGPPSERPSDPPRASDGRDVDACFDGNCEIAVTASTTIPLDSKFGLSELVVDEVTANSVKVAHQGGSFSMSVGAGGATGGADGNAVLAYGLVAVTGGEAIIRFAPSE